MKDDNISKLCKRLGYKFKDTELLMRALTHSSAARGVNNERLEFLGDSVIQLVVTHRLYGGGGNEGDMTADRQRLVSHAPLKEASQRLGLYDFMIKSPGDIGDKAHSSVYEAVAGAVFADGGYAAAEKFIARTLIDVHTAAPRNYKGALQEHMQSEKKQLPAYMTEMIGGTANKPVFRCVLVADGKEFKAEGGSKAEAERKAAEKAMKFFRFAAQDDIKK